jgi:hypothetical protein
MAENIVAGLFGLTPEMYGQQQRRSALQEGIDLAQLDPASRGAAMTYAGAKGLGGAIAGALGVQDPALMRMTQRNQLLQEMDISNPESLIEVAKKAASTGDSEFAMALIDKARKGQSEIAQTKQRQAAEQASLAQAAKTNLTIKQEEELRSKLSALGPNATQDQVIGVLTQYGPPEKVLAALTAAQSKTEATLARTAASDAANQAKIEAAKTAADAALERNKVLADAKIEAARERGATDKQIAQMRIDAAKELAQSKIESAKDLKEFANSLKGPKTLAPSLQKEEDKELELVDSLKAREDSLAPAIASLTPDPKTGKISLELGPVRNLRYQAQNAAGNSTPESQRFAELERAVQAATNLKTDAAKGVQTDKDVLRFANELIAAYGKYDTTVTMQALNDFVKATVKARENAQKRIDSRRKSQGVEPYYGPAAGTAQNPIKLD